MKKDTSRTAALDYLLAIGNLIALADHKEEQIMNLVEERNNLSSVTSDPGELEALKADINNDIAIAQRERLELYQTRKSLQRNFFNRYEIDNDWRCQFKHYAIALTAMEECANADNTVDNRFLLSKFRKLTYQFLWTAMWVWPANCWRCLADILDPEDEPTPEYWNFEEAYHKPDDVIQTPEWVELTSPFKSDNW